MLYQNKSLADLFLAFSVAGQLVAIVCLLSVLMFFSSSLRDDPLPANAADAPNLSVDIGGEIGDGVEPEDDEREGKKEEEILKNIPTALEFQLELEPMLGDSKRNAESSAKLK